MEVHELVGEGAAEQAHLRYEMGRDYQGDYSILAACADGLQ